MTTITISLPDSLKAFVEQQVASQGYGNVSEYFRALLRSAHTQESQRRFAEQLSAGLGGVSKVVSESFWTQLRAEAQRLLASDEPAQSPAWPLEITRHRQALGLLCRQQGVRELALVGAATLATRASDAEPLELAVHLGERSGTVLAEAYASFRSALASLLDCPIDLIEIGSMGPTRLRRLLEQTRRVLYRATDIR